MSDARPVVLITGSSSGIGRACAVDFARKGWRVFASMRRPERGESLRAEAAAGGWALSTPPLDVTDDASVARAVEAVLDETAGRVDALVNNAGFYTFGPVEQTAPDELRAQFETNVVGVLRVTRAVLPAMRARRDGAVVLLSSVSGRVVVPIAGPYHASKYALEALGEALRYEVAPFGVRVTLVEPGPFHTELHVNEVQAAASRAPDGPYQALLDRYAQQSQGIRRGDVAPVVDVIFRAATHPHPKLRWPVGPTSLAGTLGRRLAPDAVYELAVRIAFKLRGPC